MYDIIDVYQEGYEMIVTFLNIHWFFILYQVKRQIRVVFLHGKRAMPPCPGACFRRPWDGGAKLVGLYGV